MSVLVLTLLGCSEPLTKREQGALAGGAAGAGTGAVMGGASGAATGSVAGAVRGGIAGEQSQARERGR